MQLKPCNRCKSCNAYARYACIMSCGSKLVFYIQVLPNVFYSRLRFFSRSPSTFSRLSHRTLRKPCRSHSRFLQSPRTVSPASHSQSGLAQSVRVAHIAQSPRTVSPGRSHRPVASHSHPVASHSQSAHIPVASHSQSAHIAQSPRTVSPLTVASPSLPFLQSRSRIARSRSRADSQSSHLPEEKHHSHPFGARPRGRG
jgi:hypothetical protein